MKKTVFIGAMLLLVAATSCKKNGECTCKVLGTDVVTTHNDLEKDEYDDIKSNCESLGCEWTNKL